MTVGLDYFCFYGFPIFIKNVWILLTSIFIILHLTISNLQFTHIHTSSLINIIYFFYFITFLLQSLLLIFKHQRTGCAIKRKISRSQALKDPSSLDVVDHGEVGNSTFQFVGFMVTWQNGTVANQSSVYNSHKQMRMKLFDWDLTVRKCI